MRIYRTNKIMNFDLLFDDLEYRKIFNIKDYNVVITKSILGFSYFILKNNNIILYAIDEQSSSLISIEKHEVDINNEISFFIIDSVSFENYERICYGTFISIKDDKCEWYDYNIPDRMLGRSFARLDKYRI